MRMLNYFISLGALSLLLFATADSVSAQVYSGRSVGVAATVNGNSSVFGDTGDLPSSGGNITITVPSSTVQGVMGTGLITASTSGALRSSQSVTVVNDVDVTVGGVRIRANRVTSNAGCICCPGADLGACSGQTVVTGLTITDSSGAQTSVTVTGGSNQTVQLPDGVGTLIINEQVNGISSVTVNGLRVNASAGGNNYDLTIASSTSGLECAVTVPTAGEVTVSGRVLSSDGSPVSKATVKLTDNAGNVRSTSTNTFGNYSFSDVPAGDTYVLQATHRSYSFSPKVVNVTEDTVVDIVSN